MTVFAPPSTVPTYAHDPVSSSYLPRTSADSSPTADPSYASVTVALASALETEMFTQLLTDS